MEKFQNKVLLIVNTASKCGLTPQYEGLEDLYQKYKDCGLVILGFPCNQFGKQEPGDETSIANECLINYGVSFPMFSKSNVNGEDANPVFKFLKSQAGGFFNSSIKWNFTKFLVDHKGNVVKRFAPITSPDKLEIFIIKELNKIEKKEKIYSEV